MTLSQPHSWASAIFINELDAGTFNCTSNHLEGGSSRFARPGLDLTHGHDADPGLICKLLLCPVEEPARRPAL